MSLGRYYSIICDVCGRVTSVELSGKAARAEAKRRGWRHIVPKQRRRWRHRPSLDQCAECAKPKPEGGAECRNASTSS